MTIEQRSETASGVATAGASGTPGRPGTPDSSDIRRRFLLDPSITFLNHGSFGSAPAEVIASQERWRRAIEARPIELLGRRVRELIQPAKEAVGRFIGCPAKEIGFVTNATEAVNAVLASLDFRSGDELLTTTHVYNAIRQAMRRTADRSGASLRELDLPLPCSGPDEVVDRVIAAIAPTTRLLVIDHVTSPTALVLPVERIVAECRKRAVPVIIDGAHAPGMLPLDLMRLDAEAYAANLHKWLLAPKGCGILRVRESWRARVHPAVISHFYGQGFEEEFDWQGTRDVSAWIAAADSVAFIESYGAERMMQHNHALAVQAHAMLCERLGVEPLSPIDGTMLGSMASFRVPDRIRGRFDSFEALMAHLYGVDRIEIPAFDFRGQWLLRVSAQIYNEPADYERLAAALLKLM